ncbi:MAG: TetR/AcrR family transcriptional regulator [Lachnospiraceae bacterium]|nr:TetR/AcrR family transcriptional regulator [Lachnospiraceae bacterium]
MARTVKPPDERRQELLDIGIDLFLTEGSSGVSIQNVISRANVATGLFYYYFKSKDVFLEEAITSYVTSLTAHFSEILAQSDESALSCIKKVLHMFSAHVEETLPLMNDKVVNTPEFHMVMHGILEKLCPDIELLIEKGISDGDFHVASSKITAGFILNGLIGVLHFTGHILPAQNVQKEIERITLSSLGVESK